MNVLGVGNELARAGFGGEQVADLHVRAGAEEVIDLGQVLREAFAVALHEAAGDDERLALAGLLVLGELENVVDGLLLGGFEEGAGVDDDDLGVLRVLRRAGSRAG